MDAKEYFLERKNIIESMMQKDDVEEFSEFKLTESFREKNLTWYIEVGVKKKDD